MKKLYRKLFPKQTEHQKTLSVSLDEYMKNPSKAQSTDMITRIEEATNYVKLINEATTLDDLKPVLLFLLLETV